MDADESKSPGTKFFKWELKGAPLRMEVGPRDIEQNQVMLADRLGIAKEAVSMNGLADHITKQLDMLQNELYNRAVAKRAALWHKAAKLAEFGPIMERDNGLYQTGWCQDSACEQELKKYKAFTRCLIPEKTFETCFNCDKPSKGDVLVAKAY